MARPGGPAGARDLRIGVTATKQSAAPLTTALLSGGVSRQSTGSECNGRTEMGVEPEVSGAAHLMRQAPWQHTALQSSE